MIDAREIWKRDPVLRIAGVVALLACWFLMRWLVRSLNLHAHRDPSLLEFVAAATGFLCFSAGGALATLGAQVFGEVDVSERWVRRRDMRPAAGDARITPACLAMLDREIAAHRDGRMPSADPLPGARAEGGTTMLLSGVAR